MKKKIKPVTIPTNWHLIGTMITDYRTTTFAFAIERHLAFPTDNNSRMQAAKVTEEK